MPDILMLMISWARRFINKKRGVKLSCAMYTNKKDRVKG